MGDRPIYARQHIQDFGSATKLEPHWGYADRVIPCTSDAGSCEYLDNVYWSHDVGMIYSGILWLTIFGILLVWTFSRRIFPPRKADEVVDADLEKTFTAKTRRNRLGASVSSHIRSYLLPDSIRVVFGRTTRLQVLILAIICGYLLIWSFVGIAWKVWVTPVKGSTTLFNVRSALGPWSDRIGILAYALTPLSIMLSSRESLLSALTGVPYQSFNFLHRWLGYVILVQSGLHTIAWSIVEIRLYQPQPSTAVTWITQTYMIWGIVAMILILLIFILSTPWGIRMTGYEAFRKLHYVLAMVYIGACYAHWSALSCFMMPALVLWLIDRAVRLIRTGLMHYKILPDGSMGFRAIPANISRFPDADRGDIVRLDFKHSQDAWRIGEHFYLTFTDLSIWQSHPFTPLSLPSVQAGMVEHSYILRAKKGETKKLAELAMRKMAESTAATTPVVLSGPYGECLLENLSPSTNVLCVAGGTGITYVLPLLMNLIQEAPVKGRSIELVWAIRRKEDMKWIQRELNILRAASETHKLVVHIFVTREQHHSHSSPVEASGKEGENTAEAKEVGFSSDSASGSDVDAPGFAVQRLVEAGENHHHPDLKQLVTRFVQNTASGPTNVYASGPGGIISDVRSIVAACNDGSKVWKGEERFDVRLTCDDRLEW